MPDQFPTPYPEVNALLAELLPAVRAILGERFSGMYLDGSLVAGDFDGDSDVDFVVVTEREVSPEDFLALQALHERLALLESPWAIQLEGFYVSRQALRRYDPALAPVPNLERGRGERLKWRQLGAGWLVHQAVLREHGLALAGPAPQGLIDPVAPAALRRAMRAMLAEWGGSLLQDPGQVASRGYQSYIVLSMCRILFTLETGTIVSKRAAARWARRTTT